MAQHAALLAASLAIVVGLGACGSGGSSKNATSTSSAAAVVDIKDFLFHPDALTVKAGSPVVFTNSDGQAHTATSETTGVFATDSIAPGAQKAVTIDKAGEYTYHCSFHPFMHGRLIVQ